MIKYAIIKNNAKESAQFGEVTYGLCACTVSSGLIEIINCVDHISHDIVWVRTVADKLNQYNVDPVHLYDIIEDELYNTRI